MKQLQQRNQWVCWKGQLKPDGKLTKIPMVPGTEIRASSNNPTTWRTYEVAKAEAYRHDGIAYMLTLEDGFVGIDLDHCVTDGVIAPWAKEIIDRTRSYVEYSQSGTGLHIIIEAEHDFGTHPNGKPKTGRKKRLFDGESEIEIYNQIRAFVVTENVYQDAPVVEDQALFDYLMTKYFPDTGEEMLDKVGSFEGPPLTDEEVINKMDTAKNSYKWKRLFYEGRVEDYGNDDSAAEMGLLSMLVFYTGDRLQIERILRCSALAKNRKRKDDQKLEQRQDYIDRSIAKALLYRQRARWTPGHSWPLTDMGNGERLVHYYGRDLRFCDSLGYWFAWDGRRWLKECDRQAKVWAKNSARNICHEATNITDKKARENILRWARCSESGVRRREMLKSAETEIPVMVDLEELDQHAHLFNLRNGTMDLRTGEICAPSRGDHITKLSPIEYDPEAKCPEFELFLDVVIPQVSVRKYLQRCFGYSMVANTSEDVWWLLYGDGGNGKSTLLNTIMYVMGGFGQVLPHCLFLGERQTKTNPEIIDLREVRFGATVESLKNQHLNAHIIKALTGGDPMAVYAKHSNKRVLIIPKVKLWLATNHEPVIEDTSEGMWRRVRKIPFDVNIPEEQADKTLRDRLGREEGAGIFNWLLEGYRQWQESGLQTPDEVKESTATYRREQDPISEFIDDCLIEAKGTRIAGKLLYNAYMSWCNVKSTNKESRRVFYTRISRDHRKISTPQKMVMFENIGVQERFGTQ